MIFQPTSAAVLGCLALVFRHLNQHEAARLEGDGSLAAPPNQGSLHGLLQKPLYDFYVAQLRSLPDTSSRVNGLIRLTAFYLQPWTVHALAPAAAAKGTAAAAAAAAPPAALGSGGGTSLLAAPTGNPEHWAYAGFVQSNFLLYARLLRTVASETRASRFLLSDKADMAMLLGVCNLFLKPHVLPLLRLMCDAAELLHAGVGGAGPGAPASAPHGTDVNAWRSSPRCLALLEQLQRLEPQPQAACASLTLAKLHSELEDLDAHLVCKRDELRKKQRAAGGGGGLLDKLFEDGGGAGGQLGQIETLRAAVEKLMLGLRPRDYQTKRRSVEPGAAPLTRLLGERETPLSAAERRDLLGGLARCSPLHVPFRATPSLPVRPVGGGELRVLVRWAEALVPLVPPQLVSAGFHPRLLASGVGLLVLLLCPASLLALRPLLPAGYPLLAAVWWLLAAANAGLGRLLAARWWRHHAPARAASCESWLPWIAQQLAAGADEAELRAYLQRTLPGNARPRNDGRVSGDVQLDGAPQVSDGPTHIDEMLARARRKLR